MLKLFDYVLGCFPKGDAEGLGEMKIFATSLFKSCIFSSTILYHFPVAGGGFKLMDFPSGRLAIITTYSNYSKASLREGLAGRKVEGPLILSSRY